MGNKEGEIHLNERKKDAKGETNGRKGPGRDVPVEGKILPRWRRVARRWRTSVKVRDASAFSSTSFEIKAKMSCSA